MKNENKFEREHKGEPERIEDPSLYERMMPESIKRGLELLMRDGRLKGVLSEIKMPKEIVAHIMSQVDETKRAALQVIGKEVRLFLEHTNLSDELAKLLTQISFEVKTQVRFVPNDRAIQKKDSPKQPATAAPADEAAFVPKSQNPADPTLNEPKQ